MEVLRLSRLTASFAIDATQFPELDAGGAADQTIRFDPARLLAMGHSMGSTIGIPWASVDPRVRGVLFSGAGGTLIEVANSAVEPLDVNAAFSSFAEYPDDVKGFHRAHPVLHVIQTMWDTVDPAVKAPHVLLDPWPEAPAKDVLMTVGFLDGYFHPRAQGAVATALGIPLAGSAAEPWLSEVLALAERPTVSFPVQENLPGRTGAVVSVSAPHTLGHYVVFNQESVQHTVACFFASVGNGTGAVIVAPNATGSACP
jgi:hypothetical protein